MSAVVMDSSVLIACIRHEPGYKEAEPLLPQAIVSAVNIAEVATHFTQQGFVEQEVRDILEALPVQTKTFAHELAILTGLLVPETKQFGLSLGDRACLGLGMMLGLPVLTADRIWDKLKLPVEIRLIR